MPKQGLPVNGATGMSGKESHCHGTFGDIMNKQDEGRKKRERFAAALVGCRVGAAAAGRAPGP